jgi:hypothetical protein
MQLKIGIAPYFLAYIPRRLKAPKTRIAGHTIAFKNPITPIQNPEACEMKYIAAPMKPSPYTAPVEEFP